MIDRSFLNTIIRHVADKIPKAATKDPASYVIFAARGASEDLRLTQYLKLYFVTLQICEMHNRLSLRDIRTVRQLFADATLQDVETPIYPPKRELLSHVHL